MADRDTSENCCPFQSNILAQSTCNIEIRMFICGLTQRHPAAKDRVVGPLECKTERGATSNDTHVRDGLGRKIVVEVENGMSVASLPRQLGARKLSCKKYVSINVFTSAI